MSNGKLSNNGEHEKASGVQAIGRISAGPDILEAVSDLTGMRFVVIATVTGDRWIACAVLDKMDFGVEPGGELELATTLCSEVRDHRNPIVIEHARTDAVYRNHPTLKKYGIESYIAVPIILKNGEFFGTLSALDSLPADLSNKTIVESMKLFSSLLADELTDESAYDALLESESRRRESEKRVRAVTDAMPGLISYVDKDYCYQFVNRAYTTWFGLKAEDIVGKPMPEVVGKDAFEKLKPHLDAALAGRSEMFESRIPYQQGGARFIRASYVPDILDGEVRGIYILVVDISEERRAQDAVKRSEERYRAFIKHSSEGIWRFELDEPIPVNLPTEEQVRLSYKYGYLAECNDAMARQYGYSTASEIVGARLSDLLVEDDPRNVEFISAFIESGYNLSEAESHERDADGNDRYFLNNFVGFVENGRLLRAWGTQRDVTRAKLADDATARLAAIVVSSEDAIISKDLMGTITSWNVGATKMFGYKAEEVIGKPIAMLTPPDRLEESAEILRKIRREEDVEHFETVRRRRDGSDIIVSLTVSPIRNAEGNVIGASKIVRDITERKRIEESIHHNQAMLTLAMQSSRMGVWERDIATDIVSWSEELEEIFGLKKGEFRGTEEHFFELIHEDDRELCWNEIRSAVAEHRDYTVEFRFHHADGSIRWMEGRGEAVYSQKGEPVRLYGVGIDITDRKEAEKELRQIEQRFSRFMHHLPGLAWIKDMEGRYVYANESAERSFGVSGAALYGKTDEEIFPPESAERFRLHDRRAIDSGTGIQIAESLLEEDGVRRHTIVSKFPIAGADGKPALIGGMAIDVTEQKQAEEALRQRMDFDEAVMRNMGEGLYTVDAEGKVTSMNPAAENLLGWKFEELRGREVHEVTHHKHRDGTPFPAEECAILQVVPLGRSLIDHEDVFIRRDGTFFDVLYSSSPLKENDEIVGLVVVFTDITERKRAEQRLALQEQISDLIRTVADPGELLYSVAAAVGKDLRVKRALFNEIDLENDLETVHRDHCAEGVTSVAGLHAISDYSPITLEEMRSGKTIVNVDSRADPRTADHYERIYEPNGERSYVAVPLLRNGVWVASLWVSDDEPREWDKQDISLLETIAERTWAAVEKFRGDEHIRRNAQTFVTLVENAPFGVYVIDSEFRLTTVNEGAKAVFAGIEPLIGRDFEEILRIVWAEPFAGEAIGHFRHTLETGEAYLAPTVTEDRHNVSRTESYDWQVHRITLPDGKYGVVCYFYDLTRQKAIELALRESEERFRNMADHAPVMVWVTDPDGTRTYLSQSWYEYTGTTSKEGLGFGWLDAVHPDERGAAEKTFRAATTARRPFEAEYRLRRADGEYRWSIDSARPRLGPDGEFLGLIGTVLDIHDRREAEAALIKAERKAAEEYQNLLGRIVPLAATLGRARDLVSIFRAVREFICASMTCSGFFVSFFEPENSLRLAAYAWGEGEEVDIAELPPMPLMPEGGGANSRAVFERRTIITNNYWDEMKNRPHVVLRPNGRDPLSSLIVPMMIKDKVLGTLEVQAHENEAYQQEHAVALEMAANLAAVAIENVRLIETEAAAREAAEAANRAKDEFLSVLSHELRTPLNAMLGWVRMLKAGVLDEENSERALEVIERNTRLQSSLIEDLLDVSRIISGKMRIETELVDLVSVVDTVSETIRPLAEAKNIAYSSLCDEEAVFLTADPVRMQQVISNLLQNSIKFTPSGGSVRVSIERNGANATVSVEDTGVGIDAELLPFIFDRFRQADASARRNFTGLGLGLTIVRNIVELHGGSVEVRSEGKDKGSTFILTLPLAADFYEGVGLGLEIERSSAGSLAGKVILLVDDDTENLLPLKLFLENEKAEVTPAESAAEAMRHLAERDFHLMITDIGMPGIDGYELVAKLRSDTGARNANLKAIALTAYASVDDRRRALECGFHAHLAKPVNFDELLTTIENVSKNGH